MKNVLIYTRVSTDEQADRGYSLRAQVERLENFCEQNELNILARFQDDYSAKTFDRPEFKKLLQYVRLNRNKIDTLLFVKWDRFSRDATDALTMIRTLKRLGVDCNAIDQPIDSNIPENRLMLALYITSPQVENERRALNIEAGMRRAKREGRWVASAPLGYKYSRDGSNRPILVFSEKADLVREIFTEYSKGKYTKEELRKLYKHRGMKLSHGAFHSLFHNHVYCGYIKVPAHNGHPEELIRGIHDPIISKEIFDRVQYVALAKGKIKSKPKTDIPELVLKGFLVCNLCGGNLTGSRSKGNGGYYYYYHCQPGCRSRFRADIAQKDFLNWLNSITVEPNIIEIYLEIVDDVFKKNEGDKNREIRGLKAEIEKQKQLLSSLTAKFVLDLIKEAEYVITRDSINERIAELSYQTFELENTPTEFALYLRTGLNLLNNLSAYFDQADLEGRKKILSLIFSEKLVYVKPNYRTFQPNEFLTLLASIDNTFKDYKKENVSKKADISSWVVSTGIEPVSKV